MNNLALAQTAAGRAKGGLKGSQRKTKSSAEATARAERRDGVAGREGERGRASADERKTRESAGNFAINAFEFPTFRNLPRCFAPSPPSSGIGARFHFPTRTLHSLAADQISRLLFFAESRPGMGISFDNWACRTKCWLKSSDKNSKLQRVWKTIGNEPRRFLFSLNYRQLGKAVRKFCDLIIMTLCYWILICGRMRTVKYLIEIIHRYSKKYIECKRWCKKSEALYKISKNFFSIGL